ncbi:MAG: hypothetical protein Q7T74_05265 [Candidatus Saccharibacteria bacterium]|nr:hypothetical protein [Candidatus Saccharibacteria bacterium]
MKLYKMLFAFASIAFIAYGAQADCEKRSCEGQADCKAAQASYDSCKASAAKAHNQTKGPGKDDPNTKSTDTTDSSKTSGAGLNDKTNP